MQSKLEIGMPAMIIGSGKPENSWLIGSVVTVEGFWKIGQDVTDAYLGVKEAGYTVEVGSQCSSLVLVSSCKRTAKSGCGRFLMKPGFANLQEKHLMPLPPLDDDAIIEATEKTKETEKC
ncbi:hypothetical protein [Pseudomonas phage vB_PseuGesM_254]|uniref:Uncharacterized protein n=1 Tax=Pseudomonas phage vB_PseuGesM_254 TaxID=3092638 RepID=A0AAX4G799_9CAUD|nr:hypothetical protein [Pseudomonas phage PseuGes_254]